jgi:hypothetical protein
MNNLTTGQNQDKELIAQIRYPQYFFSSRTDELAYSIKNEFYEYILNAVKRFLGVRQMTEEEKRIWLIVITTKKHGLIYFMNKREAQENLNFAIENKSKIKTLETKLQAREKKTRDLINYAFHRFVHNPKERIAEKSISELVSYDAITSICQRRVAIRKGGPFDSDPDASFYETNEEARKKHYYYDEDYNEHYDGHHLAHYLVSLLGDYDYLDYDPYGSASCLPKPLRDLFTNPSHPLGSFVIFTWLLRPLLHEIDNGNNDNECVTYMASHLKDYLLARKPLFNPTKHEQIQAKNPISTVELAVSVQSAIGEMPVALAEARLFTRGANSRRLEDVSVDPLDGCSAIDIVYKIANQKISIFQRRIILRQRAKLSAYFLVANELLKDCSSPKEIEVLQEILYRIRNCNGAKINGMNLHHRLYKTGLIAKESLERLYSIC